MPISRSITLLCLAQMVAVICGFAFLEMRMRGQGYPGDLIQFIAINNFGTLHWSYLALFLRRPGLILLVATLTWSVVALLSERRGRYILPFGLWMVIGTICPCAIIMTYFYASFHPCVTVPN